MQKDNPDFAINFHKHPHERLKRPASKTESILLSVGGMGSRAGHSAALRSVRRERSLNINEVLCAIPS